MAPRDKDRAGPRILKEKGVKPGELVFDGPTLANVYLGNIKMWDDPAIKKLNSTRKDSPPEQNYLAFEFLDWCLKKGQAQEGVRLRATARRCDQADRSALAQRSARRLEDGGEMIVACASADQTNGGEH